ncbi:hypothetical protein CCP3SC1AL1_110034 [Gammaproteobacteria bacterium]
MTKIITSLVLLFFTSDASAFFGFGRSVLLASKVTQSEVVCSSGTGGTITTDGDYTVHTFTSGSTTFTPASMSRFIDLLVVAGGGGGGNGGGGGGGGQVKYMTFIPTGTINVSVGGGGANGYRTNGSNGGNSIFGSTIAYGGGGGGGDEGGCNGLSGGTGGGGCWNSGTGGSANYGVYGSSGGAGASGCGMGGGGGAGGPGKSYDCASGYGKEGGDGYTTSISGTSKCYGAGGSGGGHNSYYSNQPTTCGRKTTSNSDWYICDNPLVGLYFNCYYNTNLQDANSGAGGQGGHRYYDGSNYIYQGQPGASGVVVVRYKTCQ